MKKLIILLLFLIWFSSYGMPCKLREFAKEINKFPKGKIDSIIKIKKHLTGQQKVSHQCFEKMYLKFLDFYYTSLRDYNRSEELLSLTGDEIKKVRQKLISVGWRLLEGEEFYVEENSIWPIKQFGKLLGKSWHNYYKLYDQELQEGFSIDAALLISWSDLSNRVLHWELFLSKHPSFPLRKKIEKDIAVYIKVLLVGMDNSPIQNWDDRIVKTGVKKEYERLINQLKNQNLKFFLKTHYNKLKSKDFKIDEQIISDISQVNIYDIITSNKIKT